MGFIGVLLGLIVSLTFIAGAVSTSINDKKEQKQHELHVACLEGGGDWSYGKCVRS